MDNKSTNEMYLSYSKEFPFWIINPENKPTVSAFNDFRYNKMIFYNESNIQEKDYLFRYSENTYDSLTIISKDPDIKYIWLDRTSSAPIVEKPFLYDESGYYLERVSFYAVGVWKMEFKRDLISLWLQFLYNIDYNNLGNIRTLTTRTNLISDNYQFEDEKLKTLPLKISGWNIEELTPANNILQQENIQGVLTKRIRVDYTQMEQKWKEELGTGLSSEFPYKRGVLTGDIPFRTFGFERTSFCEYYVFNTELYGMVFIPKVSWTTIPQNGVPINHSWRDIENNIEVNNTYYIYRQKIIDDVLVNNYWANQFMGIFILPNWLTTSIPLEAKTIRALNPDGSLEYTFDNMLTVPFGIGAREIMSIDYQIPEILKTQISKNRKLGVKNNPVSQSILQVLPTYLNTPNVQINFQKYPDFFDLENNVLNFRYEFIFSGFGIVTYFSKYETMENWIKNLPQQLPSSSSKFAQFVQANQNTLQTGIWVKQEEAKVNQATGIANALVGAGGAGIGIYGIGKIGQLASAMGDPLTATFANINGGLGTIHGANQAIQGITNAIRAVNEVKFEKARVKAKYADTFNSSTRQINYAQGIDALSKEILEAKVCDVIIHPIIDNLEVLNDTIVRCGNKTYEYFNLNKLLTISENKKYNYFEINSENFYKETANYQKIWDHFTFEEISQILEWLEEGIRLWNTKDVEYEYQE